MDDSITQTILINYIPQIVNVFSYFYLVIFKISVLLDFKIDISLYFLVYHYYNQLASSLLKIEMELYCLMLSIAHY